MFVCLPSTMESIHLNICPVRTSRIRRHSISGSGRRRRGETKRRLTVERRRLHVACSCQTEFFFITGGRTVLCRRSRWPLPRHLKRQFLLTHKEELMESPPFLYLWVRGHAGPLNWLFLVHRCRTWRLGVDKTLDGHF